MPRASLISLLPPAVVSACLGTSASRLATTYPPVTDRGRWEAVDPTDRAELLGIADVLTVDAWPVLLAADYAAYHRTGDRIGYEEPYFARRTRVAAAVLAAGLTGDDRWVRDAVDGLWLICEETTWTIPAHATGAHRRGSALVDPADRDLDLFCAETGALLAWCDHVLGDRLDEVSSTVRPRLRDAVFTRVLEPFRTRRDWRWLTEEPNNWNPWIHANLLACAMLIDPDPHQVVTQVLEGLDLFLNSYPDDGGCDEGATYWGRAGGSLGDALGLLHDATDGRLDGFAHPKIAAIARYLPGVQIGGPWHVNFADGSPLLTDRSIMQPLLRLGRHTAQHDVVTYALTQSRTEGPTQPLIDRLVSIQRVLGRLFDSSDDRNAPSDPHRTPDPHNTPDPSPPYPAVTWLPDTEVLIARERPGLTDGLFVAVKGGHNAESHNHNDVGTIVVALDGVPRVIDLGVGTYTQQTFGPDRYAIATMQSDYHNVPQVNGYAQSPGRSFAAADMESARADDRVHTTLDLASAYPTEAGLKRWERHIVLDRPGAVVTLTDNWRTTSDPELLVWHLLVHPHAVVEGGAIRVVSDLARDLLIHVDPDVVEVQAETISLLDPRLSVIWGNSVTRLRFTATPAALRSTGSATWVFTAAE